MILPASLLNHARRGATTAASAGGALFSTQRGGGGALQQTGKCVARLESGRAGAHRGVLRVRRRGALPPLAVTRPARRSSARRSRRRRHCCIPRTGGMVDAPVAAVVQLLRHPARPEHAFCRLCRLQLHPGPARPASSSRARCIRVLLRRTAVAAPGVDPRVRQMNVYGGALAVAVASRPEVVALVARLRRRRGEEPFR